jgi:hypothetical protein
VKLAPGSAPWLLRHELRLAWRGIGVKRLRTRSVSAASSEAAYHFGVDALRLTAQVPDCRRTSSSCSAWAWFVFTLISAGRQPVGQRVSSAAI